MSYYHLDHKDIEMPQSAKTPPKKIEEMSFRIDIEGDTVFCICSTEELHSVIWIPINLNHRHTLLVFSWP